MKTEHLAVYGRNMRSRDERQELVDLCFEIALVMADSEALLAVDQEKRALWIAKQLRACGYDTVPVGMSWGVLKDTLIQ